ncbi:MAG: hypothetical protein LBI41_04005 [Lactobacillales bacterium]|nr:hypothetical protein [Lactobacillales bacterium]
MGTNGYNGINTPANHQNDEKDKWFVIRLENKSQTAIKGALIIKQNPIAIQRYKFKGFKARYDQSDIKISVTTWYSGLPVDLKINGVDFHEYILPVTLHGEDKSSPYEPSIIDQRNYRSLIDLDLGTIQAFVPSFIDISPRINYSLDIDGAIWRNFISEFPSHGNLHPYFTWLRSPLYFFGNAANIGNNICSSSINNSQFGVRPAFWVKVK